MVWKRFSRFRLIFLVIVLLSLPLLFLYAQRRVTGLQKAISGPVIDVSLMIQDSFASMVASVTDSLFALSAAFDSHDELVALRAQTHESRAMKLALAELQSENIRLKQLMDFSTPFSSGRVIGSHVIGRTGAPLSRTLQIDRGRDQGVNRGDAVVGSSGAVGQVLMTGRNYSDVLLLTDSTSAIEVLVQRTRARGLLKGVNGAKHYRMRVNDFDRLHEVAEGDVIVTSGMGGNFPAGVPIGEIVFIKQQGDSLYLEAEIKPFTQFDNLEEVLILANGDLQKPWQRDEYVMEKLEQSTAAAASKRK